MQSVPLERHLTLELTLGHWYTDYEHKNLNKRFGRILYRAALAERQRL